MLIDTHCHLQVQEFSDDRDAVVARAHEAGIGCILVPSTEPSDFHPTLKLAQEYAPLIVPALGIHPHDAEKANDAAYEIIRAQARKRTIAAVGECGLDFYRALSPAEVQIKNLERHCEIAMETGLPIILHCREAYPALLKVLRKYRGLKAIQHSFSGGAQDLEDLLEVGCVISFSAMVTYPKNEELRECARKVPEDRLFLETDAPFLPPQSKRGKRNEPANVAEVYRAVASARGVNLEVLSAVVEENVARFLELPRLRTPRPTVQEDFVL